VVNVPGPLGRVNSKMPARSGGLGQVRCGSARPSQHWGGASSDGLVRLGRQVVVNERQVRVVVCSVEWRTASLAVAFLPDAVGHELVVAPQVRQPTLAA